MEVRQLAVPENTENVDAIRFLIGNTNPAFANTIRRIILSYVKTLAIDEVIIVENTLALFDEFIAHRLGLVPLNSEGIELADQESCENCQGVGCNECTVNLRLSIETDSKTKQMIYSREIVCDTNSWVYPVSDDIPIMKMGTNQRLILEAVARMGTGREHAKWQPTASLGYQFMPLIQISGDMAKVGKSLADACPRNVLSFDDENEALNIQNLLACNLCQECTKTGDIVVSGDDSQIIFYIESTGALPVDSIVTQAADILEDFANDFIESLQEGLEEYDRDPRIRRKVISLPRIGLENKD